MPGGRWDRGGQATHSYALTPEDGHERHCQGRNDHALPESEAGVLRNDWQPVDHDVDINNDTDVLHAIATRVRADHDVFMVPFAKGNPLDPASYDPAGGSNLVTKMGIDATRKSNYPDEISVPGIGSIDMADYIPGYNGASR